MRCFSPNLQAARKQSAPRHTGKTLHGHLFRISAKITNNQQNSVGCRPTELDLCDDICCLQRSELRPSAGNLRVKRAQKASRSSPRLSNTSTCDFPFQEPALLPAAFPPPSVLRKSHSARTQEAPQPLSCSFVPDALVS